MKLTPKNTYGNLLDGVNFDLYYPASSVSFTGGDAVLSYVYKGDLLTAELKSGEPAKSIMVDENSTFTLDANIARFFEKATCTYTSTACKWWEENPNVVFKGWELVGGKKYKLPETEDGEKTLIPDDEQILFAGNVKVSYTAPTLTAEEKEGKPAEEQEKLRGKRRKLSQRQRNRCGTVTAL